MECNRRRTNSSLGNHHFHGRKGGRQVLCGILFTNFSELYNLLLSALSVASSSDAAGLVMKAIRAAISLPQIFDFQQLVSLPSIQQFRKDKNAAYDFLQIFLTGDLESYRTFTKSHPTWLTDNCTLPILKSHN